MGIHPSTSSLVLSPWGEKIVVGREKKICTRGDYGGAAQADGRLWICKHQFLGPALRDSRNGVKGRNVIAIHFSFYTAAIYWTVRLCFVWIIC